MAEKSDTIKQEIERKREVLGANLQRLENRFRSVTDWRTWLHKKPLAALGIAFGAGLYLATRK